MAANLAQLNTNLQPVFLTDPGTNDVFQGTPGDDVIRLDNGNDTALGGAGNDTVYDEGTGNDVMSGGAGNDQFYVGAGNDTIDGGEGSDTVSYTYSDQLVAIDLQSGQAISQGIDLMTSIENVNGSQGNDSLLGSSVANHLFGWDGNDRIDGRGGNDHLEGGVGHDTILGGDGDDVLAGQYEGIVNPLTAALDNDTLDGGNGNDVLIGGPGWDTLTGGAGADRFVFGASEGDTFDTITDFQHGVDKIDVRGIDARPGQAGDQAFTFDSTPDGSTEEFFDGLSDDWQGLISNHPGPTINAELGEIEYRHADDGYTYVYLGQGDGITEASFRIKGHVELSASDFLL